MYWSLVLSITFSSIVAANSATAPNLKNATCLSVFSAASVGCGRNCNIEGDIAVFPASTFVAFGEERDVTGTYSTSKSVSNPFRLFASNYKEPTPQRLDDAAVDFNNALAQLQSQQNPDVTNLGGGDVTGLTIPAGLYHWDYAVRLAAASTFTLNGTRGEIFVLQINGALTMGSGAVISLVGGVTASSVFWYTLGSPSIGADANFSGIVLSNAAITIGARSIATGILFSRGAINLATDVRYFGVNGTEVLLYANAREGNASASADIGRTYCSERQGFTPNSTVSSNPSVSGQQERSGGLLGGVLGSLNLPPLSLR